MEQDFMRDEQVKTGELIASLEKAIKCDRNFFVAAKADPQFQHVRANVDKLLARLYSKAKSDAKKALNNAQSAVKKMIDWRAAETSMNDFNIANTKLSEAQGIFEKKDYISYLDALSAAVEAKNKSESAINAQKFSILKTIEILESESSSLEANIRPLLQELNPLIRGYLPSDFIPENNFTEALEHRKKAQRQLQVDDYDSYLNAQVSLRKCVDILKRLHIHLSNINNDKHKAKANLEYQRNLREIDTERNYNFKRFYLSFLFILIPIPFVIILAILYSSGIFRNYNDLLLPSLLLSLISAILYSIGCRIWNYFTVEPCKKFKWSFLWFLGIPTLSTYFPFLLLMLSIAPIKIYLMARESINGKYRDAIQLADKQRSDYLSKNLSKLI